MALEPIIPEGVKGPLNQPIRNTNDSFHQTTGGRYMCDIIYLDEVRQQRGRITDPLESVMQYYGLALTRENYLALNYPDGTPEWTQELESTLPKWAQKNTD